VTFCSCVFRVSLGLPVALPLRDPFVRSRYLDRSESMVILTLTGKDVKGLWGAHHPLAAGESA